MVAADIDNVFMNMDELAEEHVIYNESCKCIFDEDESSNNKIDGVYNMRRRLFISKDELGYRPEPEEKMNIDGVNYYVIECIGNDLYEVILEVREM